MIARRQLVLGVALAATLGAVWWASTLEQEPPAPPAGRRAAVAPASPRQATPGGGPVTLAGLDAPRVVLPEFSGFLQPKSLQPPPPPPPPPPKPQAPPLPFRFVGAVEEGGQRSVFLMDGTQVRVVKAGDDLGAYTVEQITPGAIEFTYKPLKQRQTLATARP